MSNRSSACAHRIVCESRQSGTGQHPLRRDERKGRARLLSTTHLVLARLALVHLVRDLPQRVLGGVAHGVVKVLVAGLGEVAQRRGVSAEVVVDLVALQRSREGAQGSKEGEVLARVLSPSARGTSAIAPLERRRRRTSETAAHLLRLLSHHEDEREVVHAECEVEQLVGVTQEDDVLDGVFCALRVLGCTGRVSAT